MTLYEKLDFIADSYNPLLFLFALYITINIFTKSKNKGIIKGVLLTTLLATVYIVQALDNSFGAWSYFNSDYSTHTAFSFALVMFFIYESKKQIIIVISSFILYLVLMLYQQYHTLTDILSTIAILSPIMYFLAYYSQLQLTRTSTRQK